LGDRYYLETQAFPELERTRTLNPVYEQLGKELGVQLAASCDVHYPHAEDNEVQKILHTLARGKGTVSVAEAEWEYDIRLTYPTSDRSVVERLRSTGLSRRGASAAAGATAEIAARCESYRLPRATDLRYPLPEHKPNALGLLWQWLREGWHARWRRSPELRADPEAARAQLKYEMGLIADKGFVHYLLILSDAVQWAKHNGIVVGPARGSAAASIALWLLGVTEVNPMIHPSMMFERFIDPARDDYPDVDLDFEDTRRDEVREYLVGKYGADRVGNVANITSFRGRSAVVDVARAFDIPPWETQALRDRITDRPEGDERRDLTIADAIATYPEAAKVAEEHPEMWFAARLEGQARRLDVHAAGLVLSATPLTEVCAVYERHNVGAAKKTVAQIAYDKRDAEYLGMLKFDFLGLTTCGALGEMIRDAGMSLDDLYALPLDDEDCLERFARADVTGIFQFDGSTTKAITREVRPRRFTELADINALSRPGSLFSGATERYIAAKATGQAEQLHPLVDQHTANTYGQIVYQEQFLAVVRDLGGFDHHAVGDIRRAIGKKKGADAFNKLREDFMEGARRNGASEDVARRVWSAVLAASGYAFNVAHSVSYAVIAAWLMWFKVYEPLAFYKALLRRSAKDGWPALVRDARAHGIRVHGVSFEHSTGSWDVADGTLYAGWGQVDGIGPALVAAIESMSPLGSWEALSGVRGIGPAKLARIREAAAANDPAGLRAIARSLARARRIALNDVSAPVPTHISANFPSKPRDGISVLGIVAEVIEVDEIAQSAKREGTDYESAHALMRDPELTVSAKVKIYDEGEDVVTLRFNRWRYPHFREELAALTPGDFVLAQGDRKTGIYKTLHVRRLWAFDLPQRARQDPDW
jgi:DNA polymerase-3 subunit alpha